MLFLKLQEITLLDNFQTSPAKIKGITDKEIVVCIGAKRLLLTGDDEVRHEIEKMIPRKVMCICVLRFSLHYINYRWSRKFVYSPLSFHYKYIVSHSTVSHLVRVKDQIKH